jgi:branched-chain amino acid transport system substrate-binding protein
MRIDKIAPAVVVFLLVFLGLGLRPVLAQQTLTLCAVQPLTGGASLWGLTEKEGLTLATEDVNSQGGINGKKLDVVIYDSITKPPVAATLTQRLIYEDKVPVIIGSGSSLDCLAMMELTEKAKVPLVIPSAASPLITEKGYKWVWRLSMTDKNNAALLGKLINQKPEWNRIAILYENTDYGRPPSEIVADLIKQSSGKQLVAMESYNKGDTDFHGQLVKIKNQNPSLLLTWGYYTEAALIARQVQEVGLKAQLLGNSSLAISEYAQLAGPASNGVIYFSSRSSYYNPDPEMQAFGKRYQDRFHRIPTDASIDGYDGITILAEVLRKVGTEPLKIQNTLNTSTFKGIGGQIKFDATGQAAKGVMLMKIEDGRTRFVEYLQP